MCAVLEISKRTYYKYRNSDDPDYLDYLMIKKVFDDSKGTYGYRRITEGLRIEYGVIFNHKKVARIMKKYNIKPEYISRRARSDALPYLRSPASQWRLPKYGKVQVENFGNREPYRSRKTAHPRSKASAPP